MLKQAILKKLFTSEGFSSTTSNGTSTLGSTIYVHYLHDFMYRRLTVALVNPLDNAVVALQLRQAGTGFAGWVYSSFASREENHGIHAIQSQQTDIVLVGGCSRIHMAWGSV